MALSHTILIIDDDPNFLEIFSARLKSAGFKVETADGGEEGIKRAKALKPALILMDVRMPDLNGVDAMALLKKDADTADIKVLFLTNMGDVRPEIQNINNKFAQESGASGYIRKTDDLDLLIQKIKSFL